MSELSNKLHDLADALENGQQNAEALAEEVANDFDELTKEQTATIRRSLLSRTDADENEIQTLNEHALSGIGLVLTESAFLMTVAAAIEDPDGPDQEVINEIRDLADEFGNRQQETETARQSADQIVQETEIPADVTLVSVTSPATEMEAGEKFSSTVEVKNVGDLTATGVKLSVEADAGVSVDPTQTGIGILLDEQSETSSFDITAEDGGDHVVRFNLYSDNAGTGFEKVDITVASETDDVEDVVAAIRQSGDNPSKIERQSLQDAIFEFVTSDSPTFNGVELTREGLEAAVFEFVTG